MSTALTLISLQPVDAKVHIYRFTVLFRCARNPTGQDHVAARLPLMIHGFLAVKPIRCNGEWPRLKLRRLFHNELHIFDFNDFVFRVGPKYS